uniref:calcium-binding protein n=1 Tax=Cellvibrio mixtus TaxID=39650 RepID=UPI0005879E3D
MSVLVNDYFDLASLAEASYADFSSFPEVKDALLASEFSEAQADDILSRWTVRAHLPNTSTGFSTSLFEGIDGFVLAFRGTEPTKQWAKDIVDADVGDIVTDGIALDQIIDLVNTWAWLNSAGVYTAAKLEVLDTETATLQFINRFGDKTTRAIFLAGLALRDDVVVDFPSNTVRRVIWENSDTAFSDVKYQTGLGLGDEIAAKGLTVTGHSLGGHLASAFTRLFPDINADALTINGAGFGIVGLSGFASKNVSNFFNMLFGGDSFNSDGILNLYGERNPEFVTQDVLLKQPGGHEPVFIEQAGFIDNTLGHGTKPITDTLAVYDLFFKMDKNVLLDDMLSIFNSSSNAAEKSLENIVSTLVRMFNTGDSNVITDDRESLHSHIDLIRKNSEFISLAEKVNVTKDASPFEAKNNFSHFLSLYHLAPFVLEGGESALQKANLDIYALWNADAALTPAERSQGKENFSDVWYQDRAAMLAALISRNEEDEINDENTNKGENDILFLDKRDSLNLLSEGSNGDKTHVINFGGSQADELTGGAYNDRIYGMDGNDKLSGLSSHDALFGGAGDDELIGGEGSDLLVGGKDKDTLIGEAGNDILKGGEGDDTYKFTGNFGRDIIIDSEGSNTLDINGAIGELTQTSKDSLIYSNASNTVEVILIEEGGKKSLLINSLSNSGSSITIDNWVSGQFGITLKEFENEESSSLHIINGNANPNQLFPYFEENQHYSASEIHGGAGGDFIHGSSGDDKLYGGDGDDWITAGNNRGLVSSANPSDIIIPAGGGGKDWIDGGDGDDVISGIASGSTWLGGDGNDMLLGGSVLHMFRFNGPSVDGVSDDVRASIAWQDFSQHFKKGFKADKKTVGTTNEHGYSAWAGIEPGTYTGASAHGNGWQYKIVVTNSTPLYDPAAINAGVSHYSYNSDNFNASFNMRISYSHPSWNDGQFVLSNGVYFEFGLLPKALKDGVTLESVANYKHLNLHGGKGDDLLLGWYARDELQGGEGNDVIYADQGNDLVDGGSGNDTLSGGWGNDTLIGGDGNDLMLGDSTDSTEIGSDDIMYGGKGNDSLNGNQGNDFLYGGDGDDQLIGNTGNDYLYGGEGVDTILGGTGADTIVGTLEDKILNGDEDDDLYIIDTYIATGAEIHAFANTDNNNLAFTVANFSASDSPISSVTSINDNGGKDTISFLGLNNLNDMGATAQGNDLVLRYRGRSIFIKDGLNGAIDYMSTGDSIEAASVVGSGSSGATTIENFLLENLETAITRVGAAGAQLVGGLLDDNLTAHAQGSIITGGKGNDSLYGGQGNDVYVIRSGDGNDTVYENGGINTIRFSAGVSPEQLRLRRVGNNLLIIISDDQHIIVNGIFSETTGDVIADKAIQRIEFNNGQHWDLARILEESAKGINLTGTEFADQLFGYGSGDTITGGKGNDKLYGDKGDDHYYFATGDGADLIDDVSGTDHIHFAAGVTESQVSLRRDTSNNLIIRINNTDSITVLNAFNAQGALTINSIEQIHFDNNNVWDVQRINAELALHKPYSFTGTTSNDVLTGD